LGGIHHISYRQLIAIITEYKFAYYVICGFNAAYKINEKKHDMRYKTNIDNPTAGL